MRFSDTVPVRRSDSCLSDLTIDQYLAGELHETPESSKVAEHLEACAACAQVSEQFRSVETEFENDLFVAKLAKQTQKRLQEDASPIARSRGLWAGGSMALAAIAAFVLWSRAVQEEAEVGERTKGGLGLQIAVQHPTGKIEPVLNGQTLRPDESIRFQVNAPLEGYLSIVSIDSARVVSAYVPAEGSLQRVPSGRGDWLDGAIVLDDSIGPERIFAVLCEQPKDVTEVVEAAKNLLSRNASPKNADRLGIDCLQTSIWFEKSR